MLRFQSDDRCIKLLEFVGLCGEMPLPLVRKLDGYYDYNRRVVTELVREGFLKERRLQGYRRRIVRTLSLTEKGLAQLQHLRPGQANLIRRHILAPDSGHGNWKKTLRLHRGAACLLAAIQLDALWRPGKQKDAASKERLVYYSTYELNRQFGRDSKGARASGVFLTRWSYFPIYYLGEHNIQFSEEAERMFRGQLEGTPLGRDRSYGGSLLLGEHWGLSEELIRHAVNPRSRLIHFSKEDIFYYGVFDRDGLRILRMILNDTYLNAFQRFLHQNGVCRPEMLPDYLFRLDAVAELYRSKGDTAWNAPDHGTFFDFQMDHVRPWCGADVRLIFIPAGWLGKFELEGGGADVQ